MCTTTNIDHFLNLNHKKKKPPITHDSFSLLIKFLKKNLSFLPKDLDFVFLKYFFTIPILILNLPKKLVK